MGPHHPWSGLGHPKLKGCQQLEDWLMESEERQEDSWLAKQG